MKKPKPKKIERLDYHACADYVASKLGVKDIRDFAGKYKFVYLSEEFNDTPYQDFWHFICAGQDVNNGCFISLYSEMGASAEDWQKLILNTFIEEFGENTEYWVEW